MRHVPGTAATTTTTATTAATAATTSPANKHDHHQSPLRPQLLPAAFVTATTTTTTAATATYYHQRNENENPPPTNTATVTTTPTYSLAMVAARAGTVPEKLGLQIGPGLNLKLATPFLPAPGRSSQGLEPPPAQPEVHFSSDHIGVSWPSLQIPGCFLASFLGHLLPSLHVYHPKIQGSTYLDMLFHIWLQSKTPPTRAREAIADPPSLKLWIHQSYAWTTCSPCATRPWPSRLAPESAKHA